MSRFTAGAVVAILTAGGGLVVAAAPAWAAPGDSSAAGADVIVDAHLGSIVDYSFQAQPSAVAASVPGSDSQTQSNGTLFDTGFGRLAIATTSASVESTAVRSRASATTSGVSFDFLGQDLVDLSSATASAECVAGGTAEAAVSSNGLSILGSSVSIDPNGPVSRSVTLGTAVRYSSDPAQTADLSGLRLTVSVIRILQETSTDGIAVSVLLSATLDGTFETQTFEDEVVASLNLARAVCEPPVQAAPIVLSAITPASGPQAGGQTVTLTGSGFTSDTSVSFGSTAATGVVVNPGGTSLTAVTPAAAASGATTVTVSRADGSSASLPYTYIATSTPALVATAISPSSGPQAGGQAVTITGSGFTPDTTVAFGSVPAASVTVNPAGTSISAVTPVAASPGAVTVTIARPGGDTATLAYTYVAPFPPLFASAISPASGPLGGGQNVTISGTGFTAGMTVSFGSALATGVVVNAAGTSLSVTTPAGAAPGVTTVSLTRPSGTSATIDYTYLAPGPLVANDITPASGPRAGGQTVTITGSGFTPDTEVTFGVTPASEVAVASNGLSLTAVVPAAASPGTVDVTVERGGATATLSYTYVAVLTPPTPVNPAPVTPAPPTIPYLPPTPSGVLGLFVTNTGAVTNAPAASNAQRGVLAATGTESGLVPFFALASIGVGALTLLIARRRRA